MRDEDQPASKNRNLLTIVLLAVGVTLSVVGLALWFSDSNRDAPLVILKADTSPFKVEPENPGGLEINSQNSPVMDLLEKSEEDKTGTEVLMPPESEPELPPIAVGEKADDASGGPTAAAETAIEQTSVSAVREEAPVKEITKQEPAPSAAEAITTSTAPAADAPSSPITDTTVAQPAVTEADATAGKEEVAPKAEPQPEAPLPEAASAPSTDEASVSAAGQVAATENPPAPANIDEAVETVLNTPPGTLPKKRPRSADGSPYFVVQFAAFKTEKSAKTTAALLNQKHAERLGGVELNHIKRGEYWRVVSDPMLRADAAALCNVFRSVGQDCITKLLEDTP